MLEMTFWNSLIFSFVLFSREAFTSTISFLDLYFEEVPTSFAQESVGAGKEA